MSTDTSAARVLRIGSRGSDLALWQARHIASLVAAPTHLEIIKTQGDEIQHLSLDKVEGKGFFTKEIEAALLDRRVDVAVHSYKDLPTELVPGLRVAAVPARGPVRDVLVQRSERVASGATWGIAPGAKVGTSSLRRKAQLRALRADVDIVDLRGNVPTRVGKVASGELDAVLLAEAGLFRLGYFDRAAELGLSLTALPVDALCPAPAQGALAVQIRADDAWAAAQIEPLHDEDTARAVDAERALLARFGGGCHLPLGATCGRRAGELELAALVAAPDGSARLTARAVGESMEEVVAEVHRALVSQGAERYL